MGAVFGGDLGLFEQAAMTGRRAIVLTTTGGGATADGAYGDVHDFLFHVHRGMLEFVGYDVLEPIITHGPAHLNATDRTAALNAVRHAFATIDDRPVTPTYGPPPPQAAHASLSRDRQRSVRPARGRPCRGG